MKKSLLTALLVIFSVSPLLSQSKSFIGVNGSINTSETNNDNYRDIYFGDIGTSYHYMIGKNIALGASAAYTRG